MTPEAWVKNESDDFTIKAINANFPIGEKPDFIIKSLSKFRKQNLGKKDILADFYESL